MKAKNKKRKRPLDPLDQKWEMHFYELKKFKKAHGHCNVPATDKHKKYLRLSNWCLFQRHIKKYYPQKFLPDRLQRLNEIGFCWSVNDKLFEDKFNLLKQYHSKHAHCNVSWKENRALAKWCGKLRLDYRMKEKRLTKERIARLNKLSFSWQDLYISGWEGQFALLKEYKKEYGHFRISVKNDKYSGLSMWMSAQRRFYQRRNKLLTAEKIVKLNSIGFAWTGARKLNKDELLNELKRLFAMRGLSLSRSYITKHGKYSPETYCNHFGSMAKAHKLAGINPIPVYPKKYSDVQLLSELQRLATLLGRTPTAGDVVKQGKYSLSLYGMRFGGYLKARKKAGLKHEKMVVKFTDKELLDEYKRVYDILGKPPSRSGMEKYGKYGTTTYRRRFGSLLNVCKKAGLNPKP